jgi:hypothetical protein
MLILARVSHAALAAEYQTWSANVLGQRNNPDSNTIQQLIECSDSLGSNERADHTEHSVKHLHR